MTPRTLPRVALALLLVACGAPEPRHEASPPRPSRAVTITSVPLRRLSREEYQHAVRDLLEDDGHVADAFPPDETFGGFETNSVAPVTTALVERYMDAAEGLAEHAAGRLDKLAPCPAGRDATECAQRFITSFGRLVYRRPLTDSERDLLLSIYSQKAQSSDYASGLRLVLEALFESPQFLYRVESALPDGEKARPLGSYELATRLSFFLWATTPDSALLDDAAAGRLDTPEGLEKVARRMVGDKRVIDGVTSFHRQWLDLRELETASKDTLASVFTDQMKAAMVEETLRFTARATLAPGDVVTALLTSHESFINADLAKLYGVPAPAQSGYQLVSLPADQRAGVLTQASVMTVLASADQTSPIRRGKFVREKLLCQVIPPPPPNVVIIPPKVDPTLTTKQRFAQHRTDKSCSGCHQMMDPIGFAFEHYDAVGAYRTVDGAFPVDAIGELSGTDDVNGNFDGAVELSARLAKSKQVRRCFATQWFRFAVGRPETDGDTPVIDSIYQAFEEGHFDARELLIAIVKSPTFRYAGSEPLDAEGATP
ncbi:MAG: DUF1592 domain-containing protein [Polyangiaceae bacterium]